MSPAALPPGPGPEVHIDRLALRVTGLDEAAARVLARLVAEGIAPGLPELAGSSLRRVRFQVTAGGAEHASPELLARLIAGEISRVLGPGQDPGYPGEEAVR
jgi:hypothetical protein